jgi:hypothetical protein
MGRKLDLIKRIVSEHPVTDPRGALLAIEKVFASKLAKKPAPLLSLVVEQVGPSKIAVAIKHNKLKLEPKHLDMVVESLGSFAADTFGVTGCGAQKAGH